MQNRRIILKITLIYDIININIILNIHLINSSNIFSASFTVFSASFIPYGTSNYKKPWGIHLYSIIFTSLFNFNNLLANLKLSSCNGSFVPNMMRVLGNLDNIISLATTGDISGSILPSNLLGTYDSIHNFNNVWCNNGSFNETNKLGVNYFISNDNAGYANNIPSGILAPDFINYTVNAATKLPPALSPTNTTFLGFMLKYLSIY